MSEQTSTTSATSVAAATSDSREELRQLIAETVDIDVAEVTDDAQFLRDLEVDSLMYLEITVQIENRYDIKIDESEVGELTTLATTYEFIQRKRAQR